MFKPLANAVLKHLGYRIDRRIEVGDAPPGTLEGDLAGTEGMTSLDEARLLYDLAREAEEGCIVEIGSFRGRSTVALARGSAGGHGVPVYAIDPHVEFRGELGGELWPADRGAFMRTLIDSGLYRLVRPVNLRSEVAAAGWSEPIALLASGTCEAIRAAGKVRVVRSVAT